MLATEDLAFSYTRSGTAVIEHLTHCFSPGATTAVTGPSGCGKSTLLYLLAGMLTPTAGKVTFTGVDISHLPDAVRSRFRATATGFVFQDAMLDPSRSVLDNVCEAAVFAGQRRRAARVRAGELLGQFGVGDRADHRPGEISGGQAQRVALCRALISNPRIILADEPTGNLDPTSARVVWDALLGAAHSGALVVLATHDPALAAACDELVEL